MGAFLRKYATGSGAEVRIPMVKAGSSDYATNSDWTPAAGDVKVSIDGAAQANIATLPSYSNGDWVFAFSNAELTGKKISVRIVDSATKAVEDSGFNIETYGHASAQLVQDLSAASWVASGDTGTGARSVTVTVNDGTSPLENARVRFTEGSNSYVAQTNASGVATFSLDDATYALSITKSGYSFTPTTQVVDGTESITKSMTAVTLPAPEDPEDCTVYATVRDLHGDPVEGAVIEIKVQETDQQGGTFVDDAIDELTSDSDGLISTAVPRGWKVKYRGQGKQVWQKDTVPDASTHALADILV